MLHTLCMGWAASNLLGLGGISPISLSTRKVKEGGKDPQNKLQNIFEFVSICLFIMSRTTAIILKREGVQIHGERMMFLTVDHHIESDKLVTLDW